MDSVVVARACRVAVGGCARVVGEWVVDVGWLVRASANAVACVDGCLTRGAGSVGRLLMTWCPGNLVSRRDAGSWTTARGWNERRA